MRTKRASRAKCLVRLSLPLILGVLCVALSLAAEPSQKEDKSKLLAIVGGDVYTITHEVIRGGTVLVKDGKILRVGQDLAIPEGATVLDAKGKYVTVADGYPDGTPGDFYLFDGATGNQLWQYTTKNMNWPMFISSDGTGIVAGSDLGSVYYFTPV